MNDLYLYLRVFDLIMYGLIIFGMVSNRAEFWASPTHVRMIYTGLGGIVVAGAYSATEILIMGVPGGPRLFVITVPLVFLAVGLNLHQLRALRSKINKENRG